MRVFIYMDEMPQPGGSGAQLRFYSNVRAYLDLGYDVEIVHITTIDRGETPPDGLGSVKWSRVIVEPASTFVGRLFYRLQIFNSPSAGYYYPKFHTALREVQARQQKHPEALHQLEGDSIANVLPFLKHARTIYSSHDISADIISATHKIDQELGLTSPEAARRREHSFISRAERTIAANAPLVLCISTYDERVMQTEWGCPQAHYLPMSIPNEAGFTINKPVLPQGVLRMLHVGGIGHLPSYRSLEFLLTEIFPRLDAQMLSKILLNVVGRYDPNNPRCRRIRDLARPFEAAGTVRFHGFVPDIESCYEQNDIQVVAATQASGLRTRIVESFARGLPVLSTTVAAVGLEGLKAGENILIADDPVGFASVINRLLLAPSVLPELAVNARAAYDTFYSRATVSRTLQKILAAEVNVISP